MTTSVDSLFTFNDNDLYHYRPAAFMAARKGQLAILKWLHELGFDLGADCNTCCRNAAKGGHLEVLQWLRSIGYDWDCTTFLWAVRGNHVDVVKCMFASGFDKVDEAGLLAARWGCMSMLYIADVSMSSDGHWIMGSVELVTYEGLSLV